MQVRRHLFIIAAAAIIGGILLLGIINLLPLNILSIHPKPEQAPQKVYDYYIIIDEKTNIDLMYVPLVVSIGDEVITEENKRYKIVKIKENRAYARFVEDITLEKYKQKNEP